MPGLNSLKTIGDAEIMTLGRHAMTLGGVVAAIAILVGSWAVAFLARKALSRFRQRAEVVGPAVYVVEKLVSYGVVVAGVMIALSTVGVNLTSIAVFMGAVGVGVGLGLQTVVKEFVAGLVILFDQLIAVGDYIELSSGLRGEIMEIGARATRIRNNDNVDVIVPNSDLMEGTVTNWTYRHDTRRIHVPFSVAYGVDKELVRQVVVDAAKAVPFTLPDDGARWTQVWLTGFGESALNFELLVWPRFEAVKRPAATQAAYLWAIEDALREAGIEIPFNQLDLRLRSAFGREGQEALEVLGLKSKGRAAPVTPAPAAMPSSNDAARDLAAGAIADRSRAAGAADKPES